MMSVLPEGKPIWRGPCRKVDVEVIDIRLTKGKDGGDKNEPEDPDGWEAEISKAGAGGGLRVL